MQYPLPSAVRHAGLGAVSAQADDLRSRIPVRLKVHKDRTGSRLLVTA